MKLSIVNYKKGEIYQIRDLNNSDLLHFAQNHPFQVYMSPYLFGMNSQKQQNVQSIIDSPIMN